MSRKRRDWTADKDGAQFTVSPLGRGDGQLQLLAALAALVVVAASKKAAHVACHVHVHVHVRVPRVLDDVSQT